MSRNPFVSESFTKIWSRHFNYSKTPFFFKFINDISFVKHKFLPYYINIGKNLTNGINYKLNDVAEEDYKSKVFLIRDLPSYQVIGEPSNTSLKLKKAFQYEGYITKVGEYDSLDAYLKVIFKSNTRSKFRRNINRLEACFDVDYTMYYGDISKKTFDFIFENFYNLFEKRYTNKGEPCGELNPILWNYYCELAYKMINEKTASLFVIYCDEKPIGITFSYHFDDILIEALTVFDIDFYRYNIGHTTILKMLDWSFNNGIKIFDYTQGDFDYKKRWSSDRYNTYYHILYDNKSIKSKVVASSLAFYFNLKRALREKKYNEKYHHLKHKIFNSNKQENRNLLNGFKAELISENIPNKELMKLIDISANQFVSQRKAIYDFLYMKPEPAKNIAVFMLNNNEFYAYGQLQVLKITSYGE